MAANFSDSIALAHEHFVSVLLESNCLLIKSLPLGQRCEFARETEACREEERIFDYASFLFCSFGESHYWTETLAKGILIFWTIYMFYAMTVVADKL